MQPLVSGVWRERGSELLGGADRLYLLKLLGQAVPSRWETDDGGGVGWSFLPNWAKKQSGAWGESEEEFTKAKSVKEVQVRPSSPPSLSKKRPC